MDDAPILRTLLFVPAHRERMVEKAPSCGADAVVLDLEDAVPPADKAAGRKAAAAAITTIAGAGIATFVRVNGLASGMTRDDVLAVVRDLARRATHERARQMAGPLLCAVSCLPCA